jgi:subtilisin-like proprotein convertase family protein
MRMASHASLHIVLLLLFAFPRNADAVTPFVNETADGSANNVGDNSSLALDARGNPHVAHYDFTALDLKYARKSGEIWTIEIADATVVVGQFCSLALDTQGNPHVSYRDGGPFDLKYAFKSAGAWIREVVDASPNSVGGYTSLALDAEGAPHVSYHDFTSGDLRYARKSGGAWTIEIVDGATSNVGLYSSLALDAQGNPHVAHYDATSGDLKYALKSGSVWTSQMADSGTANLGQHASLALDAQGNPHMAHYDATSGDLRYARKSGGAWTRETADAAASFVGLYTSIALDAQGNPSVSYYDGTNGDLKFARKTNGAWTIETADGSADDVGSYTSLALDAQGNPHVSYRDFTARNLKYASAAVRVFRPAAGVTWAVGSLQDVSWSGAGPVDLLLSVDGGATYLTLFESSARSPISIRVPHTPSRFARMRLRRAAPLSTSDTDSFFTIDATIALAKFEATRSEAGTRLSWETRPGPEADIRYRVERSTAGASFHSIADALDRSEFIDSSPSSASHYRLIAINGLGEEYVMGETSVRGALAANRNLAAYPNPAGGPVQILYRIPFEQPVDLAIYDASGRRIRSLVSGHEPVGVQSVAWDRRDDAGRDVAAGTYFARLTSGDGFRATERITIVR